MSRASPSTQRATCTSRTTKTTMSWWCRRQQEPTSDTRCLLISSTTSVASELEANPVGIAFDASGNLYVRKVRVQQRHGESRLAQVNCLAYPPPPTIGATRGHRIERTPRRSPTTTLRATCSSPNALAGTVDVLPAATGTVFGVACHRRTTVPRCLIRASTVRDPSVSVRWRSTRLRKPVGGHTQRGLRRAGGLRNPVRAVGASKPAQSGLL